MSTFQSNMYERFENIVSISAFSSLLPLKLSLVTIVLAVAVYYLLTKKPKVPKKRIPGPKVNGFITNVVPLISIFRNNAASKRVRKYILMLAFN